MGRCRGDLFMFDVSPDPDIRIAVIFGFAIFLAFLIMWLQRCDDAPAKQHASEPKLNDVSKDTSEQS